MLWCLANCSCPQVTRAFSSRSRPASQPELRRADHARVHLLRIPRHLVQLVEAWYRLHEPHHPHPHVVIRQGPAHRGDVLQQVLRIRRRWDCAGDRWRRDHSTRGTPRRQPTHVLACSFHSVSCGDAHRCNGLHNSFSGVIGRSRTRVPVAWNTAFAMAGATPPRASSQMPFTPSGLT
jgi:hypothetical protein